MLPCRSAFPDFGPDPDFVDQTGPDLVWILVKRPEFSTKKINKIMHKDGFLLHFLNESVMVNKRAEIP